MDLLRPETLSRSTTVAPSAVLGGKSFKERCGWFRGSRASISASLGPVCITADVVKACNPELPFKEPVSLCSETDSENELHWIISDSLQSTHLVAQLKERDTSCVPANRRNSIAHLINITVPWGQFKIKAPWVSRKGRTNSFTCQGAEVQAELSVKNTASSFEVDALKSMENITENSQVAWVDIAAEYVESIQHIDLIRALKRRNEGKWDDLPSWLTCGLQPFQSSVTRLLLVNVPAGVKKGQKIAFWVNGKRVKARYNGEDAAIGAQSVFAVLS